MHRNMVEAGAHVLAGQDTGDVHAQRFLADGHFGHATAVVVQRRAGGLEQLAGTQNRRTHAGRLVAARAGLAGRRAIGDRKVGHGNWPLEVRGHLGARQGARSAGELDVDLARPGNAGHHTHAKGRVDDSLAGKIRVFR